MKGSSLRRYNTLTKIKELTTPTQAYFKQHAKGKSTESTSLLTASKGKLEKLGYHKGYFSLDKVVYSLEFVSEGKNISVCLFDLRKHLVSQQTKSMKKPYPKDFLFEISLFLVSKERIDLLLLDEKSLKKLIAGVEAILLMKEVLKEMKR